jgi:hypothetical protein
MFESASSAGTCSQSRSTAHPESRSNCVSLASRSALRASLGRQYETLLRGATPCSGQLCQKHPSTKIASCQRVKAISGRQRPPLQSTRKSTRKRHPAACRAERRRCSGLVSRRLLPRMLRATASDRDLGAGGTQTADWGHTKGGSHNLPLLVPATDAVVAPEHRARVAALRRAAHKIRSPLSANANRHKSNADISRRARSQHSRSSCLKGFLMRNANVRADDDEQLP